MSNNSSIRLHPKYGVNPTISSCIICGKEKNEIALLGATYKEQAPMHMVISIEPCDDCKEKYLTTGIMLVECNEQRKPNGNVAVILLEAFKKIFNVPVPLKHTVLVEQGMFSRLGIK